MEVMDLANETRAGENRPTNIFGIKTGTLRPDGTVSPWEVGDWTVRYDRRHKDYLAYGPEADTGRMKYRVAAFIYKVEIVSPPILGGKVLVVKHPRQVKRTLLQEAERKAGVKDASVFAEPERTLFRYDALLNSSVSAPVYMCLARWDEPPSGDDDSAEVSLRRRDAAWTALRHRIEEEAAQVYGLLGFYLDRKIHTEGYTGWDMLSGKHVDQAKRRGGSA